MDIERQNFFKECDAQNKIKQFENFKREFETILKKNYGIDINDCTDEEGLKQEFESGSTPNDFVEYLAEKHDLNSLN